MYIQAQMLKSYKWMGLDLLSLYVQKHLIVQKHSICGTRRPLSAVAFLLRMHLVLASAVV